MATQVSIQSNALLMLGGSTIDSPDQTGDHARLARNLYPSVRDDVLRLHSWNCATKRVMLSPLVATPAFDFSYQFQLPGDWLRTLQVGKKGASIAFRNEGMRILANVNTLPLVYCFRNDIEATWSANLIHVMELAMAAKMAYAVTSSASMRDSMRDEYMRELKVAKAIDGQDDPPEEFEEGTFLESRL